MSLDTLMSVRNRRELCCQELSARQTLSFYLTNLTVTLPVKTPGVRQEQSLLYFEEGNVVLYHVYDDRILFYYT